MVWAAASLLVAITAATGKTAQLTSLGSQTPSLDALADEAISESVLWSFGATSDDGQKPFAGMIADKWGNLYSTTKFGGTK
jgi:deoxyxylulose-5-phosphate synthase